MSLAVNTNIQSMLGSGVQMDSLAKLGMERLAEHGVPPCDLKTTAYHEAGHVVLAAACQGVRAFNTAYVWPDEGMRWEGFSSSKVASKYFAPVLEIERALEQVGRNISGVAGELVAGASHPSSSLEEVMTANAICSNILLSDEYEPLMTLTTVLVIKNIKDNEPLFEACAQRLIDRRWITKGWMRKRRVKPMDWTPAVDLAHAEQSRLNTLARYRTMLREGVQR